MEAGSINFLVYILVLGMNREKCDLTLPWYQTFWITTIRGSRNDDGDGNENGKKAKG